MRHLAPVGGYIDHANGILTTPGHAGIPVGIVAGMRWAADNEAYSRGFDPARFFPWLVRMEPYKHSCLFVPVPDVVGDSIATLSSFRNWIVRFDGWPLAFVAQDGQENLPLPDPSTWGTLFVGGSTEWKESMAAVEVIRRAQAMWKHIHIGRVNWKRRYNLFNVLKGSEGWTYDGTRTRYDGTWKTIRAWGNYQLQPALFGL